MNKLPSRRKIAKHVIENLTDYYNNRKDEFSCNWIWRSVLKMGYGGNVANTMIADYATTYRPKKTDYVGSAWLTTGANFRGLYPDSEKLEPIVHAFRIRMIKAWGRSDHAQMAKLQALIENGKVFSTDKR